MLYSLILFFFPEQRKPTEVVSINYQGKEIPALNGWLLTSRDLTFEEKLFWFIIFTLVAFTDHELISFGFKIWVVIVGTLVYLVISDRAPVKYVFHTRQLNLSPFSSQEYLSHHQATSSLSIIQCDFSIPSVKVVDDEDIALRPEAKLQLKIVISTLNRRWVVWRTFQDILEVFKHISEDNPKEKISKLNSFRRLKKIYKKDSLQALTTETSLETLDSQDEDYNYLFYDQHFLQLIQIEVYNWLLGMRGNMNIGDCDLFRALLKMPPFISKRQSIDTRQVTKRTQASQFVKHSNSVDAIEYSSILNNEPKKENSVDGLAPSSALTTTSKEPENKMYKGNTWDTIEFLHQSVEARSIVLDCRFNHDFKVRGLHYMTDKVKVEGGPAIGKLVCYGLYRVNKAKYGDRHDHICRLGKVREQIKILTNLPDKPFIFVMNIQIPGDPPYSSVFYFAIPNHFHDDVESSPAIAKAKKLFEKFIDIPITDFEEDELNSIENNSNGNPNTEGVSQKSNLGGALHEVSSFNDIIGEAVIVEQGKSTPAGSEKLTRGQSEKFIDRSPSKSTRGELTREKSAPIKSEPPQRSWASDISWPEPGSPGVYSLKDFQNMRFKLVPQMLEAPWVVKMAVGATPCILGQKIVVRYFRGQNYFEMDLHVGSSGVAEKIVSVCRSYSNSFVCNLGVVLQGENEEELPEQLLACATLNRIDFKHHEELD